MVIKMEKWLIHMVKTNAEVAINDAKMAIINVLMPGNDAKMIINNILMVIMNT